MLHGPYPLPPLQSVASLEGCICNASQLFLQEAARLLQEAALQGVQALTLRRHGRHVGQAAGQAVLVTGPAATVCCCAATAAAAVCLMRQRLKAGVQLPPRLHDL